MSFKQCHWCGILNWIKLNVSKAKWTNSTLKVLWNLGDRQKKTLRPSFTHFENKINIQNDHTRKQKHKIFVIMPLYWSRLQLGKIPTKNYLVRQISKQPGQSISVSQVFENLRKFDGCNCRLNCRRASFNQDDRTFFKAWKPFNCEEEGRHCYLSYFKTWGLIYVIFWNLGDRENFWQIDIKLEQHCQKPKF